MPIIKSPVPDYTGQTGSVVFVNGEGFTEDANHIEWFKEHGYEAVSYTHLARREFFYFCHLLEGDFYEYGRQYLVDLCDALQDFYEGDIYNVDVYKRQLCCRAS